MVFRHGVLAICLATVLLLSACEAEPGEPTQPVSPPVGEVDDSAGFYVEQFITEATAGKTRYVTHRDTALDDECKIEADATGDDRDIQCIMEVDELDLYVQGVALQYNVPTTMCTYFLMVPYYYYGLEPGTGPTTVQVDTDASGAVGIDNDSDGVIDGAATTTCQYDYTSAEGPNCCEGNYTRVDRTWNATGTTPGYETKTTQTKWGGSFAACIDGPAKYTQTPGRDGYPTFEINYVEGLGLNKAYEPPPPIENLYPRSLGVYLANWFDPADHPTGDNTPLPTRPGTGARVTSPYYSFYCLDRDREVLARIRLMVRDWDTSEAFEAMETDPDAHSVGLGTFEDDPFDTADPPAYNTYVNDYYDWGDWGNSYPGLVF